MKILYLLLLLLAITISGFAQKPSLSNLKKSSLVAADNQSFSVLKVFPNPVKDMVTIELRTQNPGNVLVNLYNILGTEVKIIDPIYLSEGDQQFRLDLSNLKTGVYILKMRKSDQVFSQVLKKS